MKTTSTLIILLVVLELTTAMTAPSKTGAATRTKADNSVVNKRDASPHELTAQDQPMLSGSTETARKIRAELTSDSALSTYAKNVKVIVIEDLITLKGPVTSEAEKTKVVRTAKQAAPSFRVENQLQVVK
jgi:osmotically-inducible protein OsmY